MFAIDVHVHVQCIPVILRLILDDFCGSKRMHNLRTSGVETDVHHLLTFVLGT